jgi:hypothetical protein
MLPSFFAVAVWRIASLGCFIPRFDGEGIKIALGKQVVISTECRFTYQS